MSAPLNEIVAKVTARIEARSKARRGRYLEMIDARRSSDPARLRLAAANQAHGFAACPANDKDMLKMGRWANIGIVTAYNDMLSAHQPLAAYPDILKRGARKGGVLRGIRREERDFVGCVARLGRSPADRRHNHADDVQAVGAVSGESPIVARPIVGARPRLNARPLYIFARPTEAELAYQRRRLLDRIDVRIARHDMAVDAEYRCTGYRLSSGLRARCQHQRGQDDE